MRISSFLVNILLVNICLLFASDCFAEEITITTYYPSPYGSYNSLQADKLGVGDNDNSGTLTSADVPSTSGYMWVKERVGIGTVTPAYNLDVNGTMRATSISLGGVAKTE